MAQFIEDEGISEEQGGHEWLSCVKNRAKFKMPHSPICDEYLRHRAKVIKEVFGPRIDRAGRAIGEPVHRI